MAKSVSKTISMFPASEAFVIAPAARVTPAVTEPTAPVTEPTAPDTLATTWSTSILVAERFCAVVGFSTFAQSTPILPVAVVFNTFGTRAATSAVCNVFPV